MILSCWRNYQLYDDKNHLYNQIFHLIVLPQLANRATKMSIFTHPINSAYYFFQMIKCLPASAMLLNRQHYSSIESPALSPFQQYITCILCSFVKFIATTRDIHFWIVSLFVRLFSLTIGHSFNAMKWLQCRWHLNRLADTDIENRSAQWMTSGKLRQYICIMAIIQIASLLNLLCDKVAATWIKRSMIAPGQLYSDVGDLAGKLISSVALPA